MEKKNDILENRINELGEKVSDFSLVLEKIRENPPKTLIELRKATKQVFEKSLQMIEQTKAVRNAQIVILKSRILHNKEAENDCKKSS